MQAPTLGEMLAEATVRSGAGLGERIANGYRLGISWAAMRAVLTLELDRRQRAGASVLCVVRDGRDDSALSVPDVFKAHGVVCVCHVRSASVLRAHSRHRVLSNSSRSEAGPLRSRRLRGRLVRPRPDVRMESIPPHAVRPYEAPWPARRRSCLYAACGAL